LVWLGEHEKYYPEYVMVLQPTSPLRTTEDIEISVRLALENSADGVVSVCSVEHHLCWMKSITVDGRLADFLTLEGSYKRRQDLPPAYILNGAIYLIRRDVLLERQTFYTERTYAYIMPLERSLDIDTSWDLYLANLILKDKNTNNSNVIDRDR
jgi:CMP-N,N'-diacetyllegionaminic acid synthase